MDILEIVRKEKAVSFIELCNQLDQSPQKTEEELRALREQGYNIELNPDNAIILADTIPLQAPIEIDTSEYFGNDWIRFGAIADTHLCSKYARLDVLNALYDVYEREGIRDVYLAGNWIDGEARFNKYDLYCIGVENQIAYFLKHFPHRKGITTHVLSGDDHCGWYVQREGINIGKVLEDRAIESGRTDIVDIGYMERDFCFKKGTGKSILRVIHPGGGSA
jgi:biotin operon repressor